MHLDWWTLALQTVNFAVLVWLLHRFLYKPVLRMVDARRAEVEKQYADARAAEAEAHEQVAAIAAERAGIATERETALKIAATQAEESAKVRRARADRETEALLDQARKTLSTERERALTEVRGAALDLGAEFARRLLAEVPVELRAEAWIERIEQRLLALPKPELDRLVQQCGHGESLRVVTASPLSSETAETWRSRLHRSLEDGITIAFAVDPNLVAGAELHFPNAILRCSWQSALAAMRSEIDAHGDAH